jgi:hypothetical protein
MNSLFYSKTAAAVVGMRDIGMRNDNELPF